MARMMPPYCPESAPPGEKELFTALATSAKTENWIVLHSLGIANHVRQVEGETDFVVIAPGLGMLVIDSLLTPCCGGSNTSFLLSGLSILALVVHGSGCIRGQIPRRKRGTRPGIGKASLQAHQTSCQTAYLIEIFRG